MSDKREAVRSGAVVVGVDGSQRRGALRWALAEARLRKVPLRAVNAGPQLCGVTSGAMAPQFHRPFDSTGANTDDLGRAAKAVLETAISEAVGETTDVEIERQVVEGQAAAVLIDAAGPGDLLVVGSRGHGGFAGCCSAPSVSSVSTTPGAVVVVRPST